jgi:hypothetical protein
MVDRSDLLQKHIGALTRDKSVLGKCACLSEIIACSRIIEACRTIGLDSSVSDLGLPPEYPSLKREHYKRRNREIVYELL